MKKRRIIMGAILCVVWAIIVYLLYTYCKPVLKMITTWCAGCYIGHKMLDFANWLIPEKTDNEEETK